MSENDDEIKEYCAHCGVEEATRALKGDDLCINCYEDLNVCHECDGSGVVTYFVGIYGTPSCNGPAEKRCEECGGTGKYES